MYACAKKQGAVRSAEQVWESYSGTIHSFVQCCNSSWFPLASDHFGTSSSCLKVWAFLPETTPLCPLIIFIPHSSVLSIMLCHYSDLLFISLWPCLELFGSSWLRLLCTSLLLAAGAQTGLPYDLDSLVKEGKFRTRQQENHVQLKLMQIFSCSLMCQMTVPVCILPFVYLLISVAFHLLYICLGGLFENVVPHFCLLH